jgi:hypothetical protein
MYLSIKNRREDRYLSRPGKPCSTVRVACQCCVGVGRRPHSADPRVPPVARHTLSPGARVHPKKQCCGSGFGMSFSGQHPDPGLGIWDKHPGSATLIKILICLLFLRFPTLLLNTVPRSYIMAKFLYCGVTPFGRTEDKNNFAEGKSYGT